jgi:hypothetical protein
MAQRRLDEKRPRISVSLDPEDYEWIKDLGDQGASESYTVSRIIRAARLAGLTLDEAMSGGVLEDFRDWLKSKKKKSNAASELCDLLSEYLKP